MRIKRNEKNQGKTTKYSFTVIELILDYTVYYHFQYPSYSGTHSSNYIHDIAIILLKTPASINSATHPVSIPADDNMDFSESTLCYMTGWGLSDYGKLFQNVEMDT